MNADTKVLATPLPKTRARALDYLDLMKPELTGLSVLTALCGFYLGSGGTFQTLLFLHTALGTLLVGGGAGALNQFIERRFDALMRRTEHRPLPSGRLFPAEAALFGAILSAAGIAELAIFVNLLTGFLAFLTWSSYLFLYTPLKRMTAFSTIIGGIPGALPPVMGWTAVRQGLTAEAWVLFAILFCWQMPHFFSLAWMYRRDYARAGFKILSVHDNDGTRTGRRILLFSLLLLPVSAAPAFINLTGPSSLYFALLLGGPFLFYAVRLLHQAGLRLPESQLLVNRYARRMFYTSLVYLPILMLVLSIDKLR
ncbi:MAG TPA: heme o synthase [Bacteroidota bacterium]|nr:heme o synthase [Bacteroidota bacterium]